VRQFRWVRSVRYHRVVKCGVTILPPLYGFKFVRNYAAFAHKVVTRYSIISTYNFFGFGKLLKGATIVGIVVCSSVVKHGAKYNLLRRSGIQSLVDIVFSNKSLN